MAYPSFKKSAECLDYKRLGNQRNEANHIIKIHEGKKSKWVHHPAVKMWEGYIDALKLYYNAILSEWIKRGYKNNMTFYEVNKSNIKYPPWFGRKDFHDAHKSNLLRKNKEYYSKFNWDVPDNLPYKWM